ncbi:hypothetical protein [Pseudobacteriovorax antillogorgiicola]|uniref:Uncharacterized protein n=1 Tax=Pseudobacteriovorax antillogorgiicola TaxID=1513793 RepID=A0A1Y6BSS1_9BACT|nr:hypothetical protein [Pseudobacteriovorax antillogorgiicola]TCS54580.1 hypothetical protein EDD56_10693 [Pseudobacteriovorax antillogorgiicola]SMF17943.1 hypothetical protein SAMN06296036_106150 [Pseudobacteriovorax antillogorgiicola]
MRLLSIIPWVFFIIHTQPALADARLGFQMEGGILQFSGPGYYDRMGEAEVTMGTTLSETTSIDLTMGAISFHNSDKSH